MLHVYCNATVVTRFVYTLDLAKSADSSNAMSIILTSQDKSNRIVVAITDVDADNRVYVLTMGHAVAKDIREQLQEYETDVFELHCVTSMDKALIFTYIAPNSAWKGKGPTSVRITKRTFELLVQTATVSVTHEVAL